MKISHKLIIPTSIFLLAIVVVFIIMLGAFKEQASLLQGFYTAHIKIQEQIFRLDRLFRESSAVIPELIIDNMMGEEPDQIAERAAHNKLVLEQGMAELQTIAANSSNHKEKDLVDQILSNFRVYQTLFDELSEICTTGDSYTASEKYPELKELGNTIKEVFYTLISLESQLVEESFRTTVNQAAAKSETVENVIWVVSFMTLGFIGVMGILITRWIIKPLNKVVSSVSAMSKGDFSTNVTYDRKDEIGILTSGIIVMKTRIYDVLNETNGLIESVQNGMLDNRGNAEAFDGGWRDLIMGVNNVIDAFVTPIATISASLARIAKGDIPDKITTAYQGDFNEIKDNLNSFIDAMQAVTQVAETMAEGDLTINVKERSTQDTLMQALNVMTHRLNQVVSEIKSAVAHVATGSRMMSAGAEEVSQGTTEQAASAEEISSSMEEMAANILQNAENALQTEKIAVQSAEDARDSGQAVAEAVTVMKAITKKIKMIEEIASQTHMLSLNATIEAAKAEEHGKGFAVVASEVRGLAERSRLAAEEITELADSGVTVTERAGKKLDRLVPNIQRTAELVQEISAASGEQHSGTEQINRAIQQLDHVIQHNAANSEEMAATAEELAGQAEQLQHTIAFFKIETTAASTMDKRGDLSGIGGQGLVQIERTTRAHDRSGNEIIDMNTDGNNGDGLDAEFERY